MNLLESMHKCCLPSGVPSESPSAYEKSLVHKIFGGRLRSQVLCGYLKYYVKLIVVLDLMFLCFVVLITLRHFLGEMHAVFLLL